MPASAETGSARLNRLLQEAEILWRNGSLEEAERRYRSAVRHQPGHAIALMLLGRLLAAQSRPKESAQFLRRALATNPREAYVLTALGDGLTSVGRPEEALDCYAKALAAEPRNADARYNFGVALQSLKRYGEAIEEFGKSLALRPHGLDALANIAVCLQVLGRHEEALASCSQALALNPAHPEANNMAGNALQSLGRHQEALAYYERAIAERGDFAMGHVNLGNAFKALRRHEEALQCYRRAQEIDPLDGDGDYFEAVARLRVGEFREGWQKYEGRWRRRDFPNPVRKLAQPLWLGRENLKGKTILLHAEQGLGDTIQFARYAPMVAALGAKVILEVEPPLVPLMARIEGASQVISSREAAQGMDFHCPLMSLPLAFGTTIESVPSVVPYITVPEDTAAAWRSKLAKNSQLLVGVAWSGNPKHDHGPTRDMPLEHLAPLFAVAGIRFVSLQKQLHEKEREWLGKYSNLVHPGENFARTAELIAALDLVISVDTAWIHWAGAIGKPAWLVLSHESQSDWRWMLDREDSPWYPTVRILRQSAPGGWGAPIGRAAAMLARLAAAHLRAPS